VLLVLIGGELVDAEKDDEEEDEEDGDWTEGSTSDAANSASMSSKSSAGSAFVAFAPLCLLFAVVLASLPPFWFFLFGIPVVQIVSGEDRY
jgi:hypothetical protein